MRSLRVVGALAVFLTFSAAPLAAQWIWVGGGPTFPMSDYGDYADTGWLISTGVGMPISSAGLNVTVEGFYGQNSHSDVEGDATNPYGAMAGLEYDLGGADAESGIYFFGEAGILFHKYSSDEFEGDSQSGLGFGGGVGGYIPVGGLNAWLEGRFMHASIESSATSFLGIIAGVAIPIARG